ncbi:MAG: biotin--[acetyl-CoA-carboxylase] ligase [Chitinophagaceae bacterium]|nr:biotin--[acetyl-CoA-carboxylase] ligase [Chitinophagaceae bacterium]
MASLPNKIGSPFLELQSTDSTNNYAMALAHSGVATHGMAVFAHKQLKGKGQRKKGWISERSKNILLSIIIEPEGLILSVSYVLNMAMVLGVYSLLSKYAGEGIKIKWPNDIYCYDKKAAGILIENIVQGNNWKYSIVGVGINVNQLNFGEITHAVSLKQITGKDYDVITLSKELCKELQFYFDELKADSTLIKKKYHQHLYKLNEPVRLKKNNRIFEAIIKGVTDNGELVVQHFTEELFSVGEVEWLV